MGLFFMMSSWISFELEMDHMSFPGVCLPYFVQDSETCLASALEELVTIEENQQIKSLDSDIYPPSEGTMWAKETEGTLSQKSSLF